MKNKWLASLALALLPTAMVVPQSVAANESCIGSSCEITFTYTAEPQNWSPPAGAVDLSFEAYGAAGGRGGAGGKVMGTFIEIPETLVIVVGGAGAMGSGIQGGFNGGGFSGGNSGTEGSGGGATDIRLDSSLESRILVAGGGGGGGGEAGGNGGHGGTEFAAHGGSGQASGGGGASQTEGGFAGASNGGFQQATVGQFGLGGSGGFSTFAGGGGGGGGWYGGGGGGADDNTCCSDGGGGGGGSSYANTSYITDIEHEAGVSWGHGWITLRYKVLPTISHLEVIQVNAERSVFSIEASEDMVGFGIEDLVLEGAGCDIEELDVNGTVSSGVILGCEDGMVSLSVLPGSFGFMEQGPPSLVNTTTYFDGSAPEFAFSVNSFVSSSSEHAIGFQVGDQLQLSSASFSVLGCESSRVENSALMVSSCSEGVVSVALLENTLVDSWQNTGPLEPITLSFTIDQTAPSASWSEVAISGSGPFSYSATLEFSEPVSISNLALAFASSATCQETRELLNTRLNVSASCGHANLEWTFVGTVIDAAGNLMVSEPLRARVDNPAPPPQPVNPAPIFVPVPVIVAPEPVVTPPVSESEAVSDSETITPITESETISAPVQVESESAVVVVVAPEPVSAVSPVSPSLSAPEPITETVEPEEIEEVEVNQPNLEDPIERASEKPAVQAAEDPVLAQPVLGEELVSEEPAFPWWPVALLLGIGALGIGAWRLSGR